jgi:hypothetical protein
MLLSDAVKKPKKQAKKQAKTQAKTQLKSQVTTQFVTGNEDDFYARFEDVDEIVSQQGAAWPSKAELDKALKQRRLWTMIEGDDGSLYYVPGSHFVNRIGYWKSKKPYPQGFDAEYRLDSADE